VARIVNYLARGGDIVGAARRVLSARRRIAYQKRQACLRENGAACA